MSTEYITTEQFINAHRSPPLRPTLINFRSNDTPPPLLDSDTVDDEIADAAKPTGEGCAILSTKPVKGRPQPSWSDSLLIKLLGPNHPEVAFEAGTKFFTPLPESPWEDRKPETVSKEVQMTYDHLGDAGSTRTGPRMLATAFQASQKLNEAIEKDRRAAPIPPISLMTMVQSDGGFDSRQLVGAYMSGEARDLLDRRHSIVTSESSSSSYHMPRPFDVKPPIRTCLPPIKTNSPIREPSVINSATLAKFTIAPIDYNTEQQLPRLHVASSTAMIGMSGQSKQTLPSLETALSALSTPGEVAYSTRSPTMTRLSPGHVSHLGPSPSSYSNPSPASGLSPPRLSAPGYWRTISRETTDSNTSEYASGAASVGISTPASSAPALSPSESSQTPSAMIHEIDTHSMAHSVASESVCGTPSDIDAQYTGPYCGGSFRCIWPGCTAAPFQTQYLLNSHANVHSNTRPHFCPVQGCPRGPGGQGFKRKNEMIRHGLVHQSPGYVCPFCPDQQHKYPRPDNLQRHVRVHHVERDRDDPQLRDVLAQRPEGGNRGRRRRLGS